MAESTDEMITGGLADRKATGPPPNPKVATVDRPPGLVSPVADGEATITAAYHGATATTAVRVKNSHAPFTWSFRNHVIPVLTKMGCNRAHAMARRPARTDSS